MAIPVVATDDGSMPAGNGRITNAATQAATPTKITTQLAILSATLSAAHQILDRANKVDEEKQECGPGRGHVIIENALHVAHGLLGGSRHQRLVEGIAQEDRRQQRENGEGALHFSSPLGSAGDLSPEFVAKISRISFRVQHQFK